MREFFAVYMKQHEEAYCFFQFPDVGRNGFQAFVEAFKAYFQDSSAGRWGSARYDGTQRAWHVNGFQRSAFEDFASQMSVNLVWGDHLDWQEWLDHQNARNAGTTRAHFSWRANRQGGRQRQQGGGRQQNNTGGRQQQPPPSSGGYQSPLRKILCVTEDAPPAVVQAAYRALALLYHPDKNPNDAAAAKRMQQVNDAWAALKTQLGN